MNAMLYLGMNLKISTLNIKQAYFPCRNRNSHDSNSITGIKTQFLNEMQRSFNGVMTLAITNKVDTMDPASIARMEGRLFIKLPGPNEKIALLTNILQGMLS